MSSLASNIAIRLTDISKTFYVKEKSSDSIMLKFLRILNRNSKRKIEALKDINITIEKGEFVGIIGHNGSGKSTMLKLITSAFPPNKGGTIEVNGKVIRLSLGMGFDPNLTARENIYVNGSILGLTFKVIGQKFDEIVEFSGLHGFIDTQVKFYSSGMVSRLAFSIAIHAEADIFLLDEFFGGVGDADFREKSDEAFQHLLKDKTILFVSHEMGQIEKYCSRVIHLDHGKIISDNR
jgi:ABC-2 type transport system ATP-binding protein